MCNLYSLGRQGPAALRAYFGAERDETGNMPELPAIFPDQMAPVVVAGEGGRTLTMMRWGIPGPKAFGERPVTNVRNVASPHWRPWLKPAYRCLVPVTAFSEYADTKPRKTPVWFALNEERPPFAFAGIWRPWTGVRGTKAENPDRVEEEHRLLLPHHGGERRRRAGASEGDAGPADEAGGMGGLARSADRRGDDAAASAARRRDDRGGEGCAKGPLICEIRGRVRVRRRGAWRSASRGRSPWRGSTAARCRPPPPSGNRPAGRIARGRSPASGRSP